MSGGRPRAPTGPGVAAIAVSGSGGSGRCVGRGAGAGRRGRCCRARADAGGGGTQASGGSSGNARWAPGPQGASGSGRSGSEGSGGSSARASAEGGGGPGRRSGGRPGSGGCGRVGAGGGVSESDARARPGRERARASRGCERERENRVASLSVVAPAPGRRSRLPSALLPSGWGPRSVRRTSRPIGAVHRRVPANQETVCRRSTHLLPGGHWRSLAANQRRQRSLSPVQPITVSPGAARSTACLPRRQALHTHEARPHLARGTLSRCKSLDLRRPPPAAAAAERVWLSSLVMFLVIPD